MSLPAVSSRIVTRLASTALLLSGSAAVAAAQTPSANDFIANGGEVFVRYIGAAAADVSTLSYRIGPFTAGAVNYTTLFTNLGPTPTAPGTQLSLGFVSAGTPIVFRLQNTTQGSVSGQPAFTFFSGAASRNPDNQIHIGLTAGSGILAPNGTPYTVGFNFEDRSGTVQPIADFDYNDLNYEIANASTSTVPEPGTWALLGTGLIAVGGVARRRSRSSV
jgi:hypothetical protein